MLIFSMRKKINVFTIVFAIGLLIQSFPVSAKTEPFGRIFTTPKQRALLDNIRRYPRQKKTRSKTTQAISPKKGVNINGIVIRSDGKNTVWINGKSNLLTDRPEVDVKVNRSDIRKDSVTITLSNPNKRITLKPGQAVDPLTGKVRDGYKAR